VFYDHDIIFTWVHNIKTHIKYQVS
jgi:hypothetical protein